ncbi:hypothetical protein OsJ_14089 [Oryza sativa Japonica Group]|uniref:Uncharacterized protein n=1 Tax=Oryza sativa subsp. japonica TaxID=39947 RepID=B9FE62_ORYSJ|nr:hypothetical protein OsJ_14089 [Oryza sativa Japonica Group]
MGPEISTVPNISEGLVEISKKMMDLAAQLRAMAAQSAKPAAFIEEAEPLYWHAVALRSRGRVFKQHRWRQYLAVTLQPRGGGVTRGEVLMFPSSGGAKSGSGNATSTSPLGLAMAPSPLAPSTAAISTSTAIQHGTGVWFSGAIFRRCGFVSAGGGARTSDGWSRAWRRACGAIRRRDGWVWHSRVAMAQIVPAPRAGSRSWRIDHGCVAPSGVVS